MRKPPRKIQRSSIRRGPRRYEPPAVQAEAQAYPKPVRVEKKPSWIKPKRVKARRSERVRDHAFLAFLHTQPCWLSLHDKTHRCQSFTGQVEADHVGRRPYGRKCSDREAVALCTLGHWQRENKQGYFANRNREWWDVWRVEEPAKYYAAFLSHGGRRA